jgi:hypothetical protein
VPCVDANLRLTADTGRLKAALLSLDFAERQLQVGCVAFRGGTGAGGGREGLPATTVGTEGGCRSCRRS